MKEVFEYLKDNGFANAKPKIDNEKTKYGFDLIKRIHDIHYIVWYDNLKHFALAVKNESKKGLAGGGYKKYNEIIIPKPIYTKQDAKKIIEAFY